MSQAAERRIKQLERQVADLQREVEQIRKMVRWNDPGPIEHLPPPPRTLVEATGRRDRHAP